MIALEGDLREAKATLGRPEVAAGRIEAMLDNLATHADVTTAIERIASLDNRTSRLETAMADTVRSAAGKAIGPWQLPAVIAACGAVVVLIVGALGWLAHQPWFNRQPTGFLMAVRQGKAAPRRNPEPKLLGSYPSIAAGSVRARLTSSLFSACT